MATSLAIDETVIETHVLCFEKKEEEGVDERYVLIEGSITTR